MMRLFIGFGAAVAAVFVGLQIYFFVSRGVLAPPEGWSFYELIVLILVALSVILAALTIFLAVLGIWGYQAIRTGAERRATERAAEVAKEAAGAIAVREAQSWMTSFGGSAEAYGGADTEEGLARELSADSNESDSRDE